MKFLESHNILFMYQFGYRKLHSITIALIEITDKIKRLLDEGNYVIGIYLDLTKAFDTVNHEISLYKLWRYGIRGHANDFFLSLSDQPTPVHVYKWKKKSITRTVNCGVPQGSFLGPLFFILYMNDIVKSVNANNIRLYTDDTGIFMYNKNIHNLTKQAKTSFRKLQHWFLCNKLTLNCSKSYLSIFHTKNEHVPDGLNEIVVDDVTIKRSASVKYIGLHINENLNRILHINSLIMTLVKYFGIFNQQKDYVSSQLARKLYYAFVYSNISYGIEVYGSCSDTSLDRLQVIQNKLSKLLLRLDPYTSTNFLYSELNILKVRDLYNTSLLLFVHANLKGNCPTAVKNYFVRKNSTYNTRQTGHLEYRRARLDLGTSGVQYAAELWNLLNDVIKIFHLENISNVVFVKKLYRDTYNG